MASESPFSPDDRDRAAPAGELPEESPAEASETSPVGPIDSPINSPIDSPIDPSADLAADAAIDPVDWGDSVDPAIDQAIEPLAAEMVMDPEGDANPESFPEIFPGPESDRAPQAGTEKAFWKRGLLKVLKVGAAALAWAIAELEAEDIPQQPSPTGPRAPRPSESPAPPSEIWALPARLGRWTLARVRAWMPESLRRLSDRNLTVTLGGISVFLVWVAVGLLGPEVSPPPPPPAVAIAPPPPATSVTPEPPPLFPELDLPVAETPAPEAPPVAETPPAPPTPPRLDLTPEQSAIAAIQEQLAAIASRYGEADIVTAIQADFRYSRLKVQVDGGGWFALAETAQDQLAQDLLDRARRLDFSKLEIIAQDDALLARSPAVGDRAVIFRRQPLPSQETP